MLRVMLLAVLVGAPVVVGPTRAADSTPPVQEQPTSQAVIRSLAPDPGSAVHLAGVALETFPDNSQRLHIRVRAEGRRGAFIYYVMADTRAGTYRAFPLNGHPFRDPAVRAYLERLKGRLQHEGGWQRYEQLLSQAPVAEDETTLVGLQRMVLPAEEPPPVCTYCPPDRLCSGNGFSRAITWDPAPVELTRTDNTLDWSRDDSPTGCKWNARQSKNCWAAYPAPLPPPFNTHWYVDSCILGPLFKDELYASGMTQAAFHNDDFGDPTRRTSVINNALTEFNGSTVIHGYQFYATGEGYTLLDATVAGAHYNNCS
ncbi:MAG: hypothetical protein HYU53_13395 [Acidobacteria bacterium]|nr:hypothetical protein [Acidobacteriota bacterium]